MIPFFTLPTPKVGGIEFPWFMLLIVIGIAAATEFARARAIRRDLSVKISIDCTLFMVLMGFLFAHFAAVIFYHPARLAEDWKNILPWYNFSISSMGGYLGAAIAIPLFLKVWKKAPVWPYTDGMAIGVTLGFAFGRLGCFTAHDHIGRPTSFFGGVDFADRIRNIDGVPLGVRHDLGLYESVILFALFGLFLVLDRNKDRFHGFFSGLLLVVYGPTRFVLDSLRATDLSKSDPRYRPWDVVRATREWMAEGGESAVELTRSLSETRLAEGQWVGFTFAQYGALALTALGIWIFAIRAGKGHMDISGELARDYKGGKVPERATEEVEPTEPEEVEPTEPGEVESPSS